MTQIVVQSGPDRVIIKDRLSVVRVLGPPASGATVGSGGVPTRFDKRLAPLSTSGDGSATGLLITSNPVSNGYVSVQVNGVSYEVGDGVKTEAAYFSADGGATARAISAIVSGDEMIWNGALAGFDLLNSTDRVSFDYDI